MANGHSVLCHDVLLDAFLASNILKNAVKLLDKKDEVIEDGEEEAVEHLKRIIKGNIWDWDRA